MKKNVFVALLLAVVMVVSCMTVFTSAYIAEPQKANAIAYVNPYVVPTIDGQAKELAWASAPAKIDGMTVLWSDEGLYFLTDLNAEFTYADVKGDAVKTVKVANGVVTGLPKGSEFKASANGVEIYVPYTYEFEWNFYGYTQYTENGSESKTVVISATKGTETLKFNVGIEIATEERSIKPKTVKANDLYGNFMEINGKSYEFVGAYGYTYTIGGYPASGLCDFFNDDRCDGDPSYNGTMYSSADITWNGTPVGATEGIIWDNAIITIDTENVVDTDGKKVDLKGAFFTYELDGHTYTVFNRDYDPQLNAEPYNGWQPKQMVYASYVAPGTEPIIDGVLDPVWNTTAKMLTLGHTQGPDQATGYVSVMWSDTGLYFLSVIDDLDLTTAVIDTGHDDHTNYNYSESTCAGVIDDTTSSFPATLAGMNKYGSFTFGISNLGALYDPSKAVYELTGYSYAGAIYEAENYYITELYVPYYTLNKPGYDKAEIGHVMSFDSSIDDYHNGGSGRDYYTNVSNAGAYWSTPNASFNLVFVGAYDVPAADLDIKAVSDMINASVNGATQKLSAEIQGKLDALELGVSDAADAAAEVADSLEEYAKIADVISAADVDAKIAAAKIDTSAFAVKTEVADDIAAVKADLDKKADADAVKDFTVPVIILAVLVVAEAAGVVLLFVKKK